MSDADRTGRLSPDDLVLRARPRSVTRFSRKLLIGVAAIGSALIFGATLIALNPPSFRSKGQGKELYNIDRKPTADGLAVLPKTYGEVNGSIPQLGPPMAGDLGPPTVRAEREAGITSAQGNERLAFRPNSEDDAERAERLRLARQVQQAREASVFFRVSAKPEPAEQGRAQTIGAVASVDDEPRRLELDPERDQNNQQRKLDFLDQKADLKIYNPHRLQQPVSPYQVMAGTVIAASLVTGINSDLPGTVKAQVTEHIYDTVTGRYLLIPQGSQLIGKYDSVIAFGQRRVLIAWNRIIRPDGSSLVIENLPATDAAGYTGLEDEVDFHTWRLIAGVALSTILGVGTELTLGDREDGLVRAIRESAQQNTNRAGQRLTERNLNLQPTLTIRPAWPVRVIVQKDLVVQPYKS